MTKHDFKAALEDFENGSMRALQWLVLHKDTIRAALLLADKVTGEPSEEIRNAHYHEMRRQGYKTMDIADIDEVALFKAMITQAQKEVEG